MDTQPKYQSKYRKVVKHPKGYCIVEWKAEKAQFWLVVSKFYPHATSAYAALGRLVSHEIEAMKIEGMPQDVTEEE